MTIARNDVRCATLALNRIGHRNKVFRREGLPHARNYFGSMTVSPLI
jgi:hypothetical protein